MFVVCLQCVAALSDGSTPSAVYGAEHLLRLMLKLPEIMPTAGMTPAQVAGLSAKLQVRLRGVDFAVAACCSRGCLLSHPAFVAYVYLS